jgi:hypothetical protein
MGLAVHRRIDELRRRPLDRWPLFGAELAVVRAEGLAAREPELARHLLFEARMFGTSSGNRSLVRRIDVALQALGLVAHDELTPVDMEPTPLSEAGTITVSVAPPGGLQRFEDSSSSRPHRRDSHSVRAARLVGHRVPSTQPDFGLNPQKKTALPRR